MRADHKTSSHLTGRKSSTTGPRFVARRSSIHGKGVFALRPIRKGERVVEYKGRLISEREADRRYPDDEEKPSHTFLFLLENGKVIDANHDGNSARWLNHSCAPNCETEEDEGRVFIHAIRAIKPGDELTYDYNLVLDEPLTKALKARYQCLCGARKCRGSLFGNRRYRPKKKKK